MTETVADILPRRLIEQLFPMEPRAVRAFEQLTFTTDETAVLASSAAQATAILSDATFLTLSPNDSAPNERVLKLGQGLTASDDGSFLTLSLGVGAAVVEGGYSVTLRSQGETDLILPTSGTVATRGAFFGAVRTVTTGDGFNTADYCILADASGAGFTVTLPAVASARDQVFVIKKIDASGNAVTLDANGTETIDGATTQAINTQWASLSVIGTATGWMIL